MNITIVYHPFRMIRHTVFLSIFCCFQLGCQIVDKSYEANEPALTESNNQTHIIVLGIAQDAGFPQIDCKKSCCSNVWRHREQRKMVSCLGLRDPSTNQVWIFDATPDFKDQLYLLKNQTSSKNYELAGVFLTHAHIGHYTGLIHLGKEALGASAMPVYSMPKMQGFLQNNGPWNQLVELNNIKLMALTENQPLQLTESIHVTPLLVPHRDEYSETVGYLIQGPSKKVLFIPDIDKWEKWNTDINQMIESVDIAFLDGSFYQNGEIPGRDMSQIPHPFITESIAKFNDLPVEHRKKVHFIHFNHTNPMLNKKSPEYEAFQTLDYFVADEGQVVVL